MIMITTKRLQILCPAVMLIYTACAGVQTNPESSSEAALRKRADIYWQNKIRLRLEKTYPLETPAFRKRFGLAHYARNYPGEVIYQKATITSVKIDGNYGLVEVGIRYSYFGSFSPKGGAYTTLNSHWTLVEGKWYHLIRAPANRKNR